MNIVSRKVAIVADIHLGLKSAADYWHKNHLAWAKWFADELNAQGITDIIVSGDFFHYRDEISVATLHVATQILDIWRDFNVIMLTGNHDCYLKDNSSINSLTVFSERPNVTVISELTSIVAFGKELTFVPWGVDITQVDPCDIIFGHFDIISFKLNGSTICTHGVSPKQLTDRAKITFTGHFHLRQEMSFGDKKIIYTGNPFQMDFGDAGDSKGYYVLDINTEQYTFHHNNISPNFYCITDKYKQFKAIAKNHIKLNLTEKAIHDELLERGKDVNDSTIDTSVEIPKLIDEICLFFKQNQVAELVIEKEVFDIHKSAKTAVNSVTKAVEFDEILKEIVDSLQYDKKTELYAKIIELHNKL